MGMDQLLAGYKRFRGRRWIEQRELYEHLAEGQTPRLLVIACSDSRVDPAQIFDVAPGELFIVRNVAALVPPCEQGEGLHGTSAAIEFAVEGLGIKTILVMGHARCGGVAAAIERGRWGSKATTAASQMRFVTAWIDLLVPVVEALPDAGLSATERGAVELSLRNLMSFPFIAAKVAEGTLNLEGARFDIATGELDLFNAARGWIVASEERISAP
jgi:carbonic anhydrase